MPIDGLAAIGGGVTGVTQSGYLADATAAAGASVTASRGATGATAFADALSGAVDGAQAMQAESKTLGMQAITGDLDDIHQAMLASSRAAVTLELVATVRNKGVDAFNEIMRMQA